MRVLYIVDVASRDEFKPWTLDSLEPPSGGLDS